MIQRKSSRTCKTPYIIRIGDRFGRLTVTSFGGYGGGRNPLWLCLCDCGNLMEATQCNLGTGNSKQCRFCKYAANVNPDGAFVRAFRTYIRGAESRGFSFLLTFEQFKDLVCRRCFYCGAEPEVNSYSDESKVPVRITGIDRRDSSLGYVLENCIPCCGTCNLAKLDTSESDFICWIKRAAKWLEERAL